MKMLKWFKGTAVVAATFLLFACGGGSGSKDDGGTPPPPSDSGANISEEGTVASLEWIESTIPGCEVVDASAVPLMMALSSPARFVIDRTGSNNGPSMLQAQSIDGECGGSLTISNVHQSGVTTYSVNFNDFCFTDYSADQPEQTVMKGSVVIKEIGTPTADGPMISSGSAVANNLQVNSAGKTIEMSFNVDHTFGNPDTWEAGTPTAGSPDTTTIQSATIHYPQEGKVHSIFNLQVKTYETVTDDTVINVTGGSYVLTNGNVLHVSTSTPFVMDYYGEIKSGTVDLKGADGGIVQVQPTASGAMTIKVNGESLDKALICDGLPLF